MRASRTQHGIGWGVAWCLFALGCGAPAPDETRPAAVVPATHRADPGPADARPVLVALGDSLTAGLGLSPSEAYPARLQTMLDDAGYRLRVVNAGVSGDTSAGGLRRLDWTLDDHGEAVVGLIVALGGNDGLRGLPVEQLRRNLTEIVTTAEDREIAVLLAGMEAPPNFGVEYTEAFRRVFRTLADEHDVLFVPFLLESVAGVAALNQRDGIHPNAAGAQRVADHLWPTVESLVQQVGVERGG